MKLPLEWLHALVNDLPEVDELVDTLVGIGLEVDNVSTPLGAPTKVIVADILKVQPIDGSDHLVLASVDAGGRGLSVVCGAPNARPGLRTALALPEALLLDGTLRVSAREVGGQLSEGVLCSPKELGVYDYAGGLIEFGNDIPVGSNLSELWPAENLIEFELTPNRGDALSALGIARDLSAKLDLHLNHPTNGIQISDPRIPDELSLRIEDAVGCPRFTLQQIDGLKVSPSPLWLQRRLAALGLRPRNNVVDVTNFVTFELGQPSHAYDRNVLGDDTLIVRRAREDEQFTALNEKEIVLTEDDLVITTPEGDITRVIGLAGVIGGLDDSVHATTTSVALEVAHFDPVTVRKTARRHGLVTDAHYRFERGVDPNIPAVANARAAQLIAELSGGKLHPGLTEIGTDIVPTSVEFRPSRVYFLMDFDVSLNNQRSYLERLGCTVDENQDDIWTVTPPSWRFDISIEEDVIVEVARLHGYDKIGETIPSMRFVPEPADPTHRALRWYLAHSGFQEALSYSFTGPDEIARSRAPKPSVSLLNPQGVERSLLRTALYPALLSSAEANHGAESLALFEIGRVFKDQEEEHLAFLLSGVWQETRWKTNESVKLDFFVVKGLLERLASGGNSELELVSITVDHLHPGVAALVMWNGREVGTVGRIHPEVAKAYGLDEVFVAELSLPLEPKRLVYEDFGRQPHAERDLAVIVPTGVPYADLAKLVTEACGPSIETVEPFDLYQGEQVPEGFKSLALRFRFRHADRSLTDQEVDEYMSNVIATVKSTGYKLRE
jgi:phenylalanyl-tRNA synthetase beta chain